MSDLGDITVCRIAPFPDGFEFEWLSEQCDAVELLLRVRGEGDFTLCGAFHGGEGRIDGLKGETDYEFMLRDTSNQSRTSRIRLVRTGDYLGVPVNYLHPDDAIYDLSAVTCAVRRSSNSTARLSPRWMFSLRRGSESLAYLPLSRRRQKSCALSVRSISLLLGQAVRL